MTMHKYLLPPAAEEFIAKNLTAVGIPYEDAYLVATLMIQSDLAGADGHGIFRLPAYIKRIRAGGINLHPNIEKCSLLKSILSAPSHWLPEHSRYQQKPRCMNCTTSFRW